MAKTQIDGGSVTESHRLGLRVKARRKSQKFTLEQLSKQSGVSRAALSKIERGEMSPTYEVLRKLATGLGVAMTTLVMDSEPKIDGEFRVVRAGEGERYGNPLYNYEHLSGSADYYGQSIYISELAAGDIDEFPELHAHDTHDFIYVLSGTVGAFFEGRDIVTLKHGDSLTFDGRVKHAFVDARRTRGRAKVLWVSRPR